MGILFTKDIIHKLGIKTGDILHVVETPFGIELTPCDPEFAKQTDLMGKVIREDHDVLKKLAE